MGQMNIVNACRIVWLIQYTKFVYLFDVPVASQEDFHFPHILSAHAAFKLASCGSHCVTWNTKLCLWKLQNESDFAVAHTQTMLKTQMIVTYRVYHIYK